VSWAVVEKAVLESDAVETDQPRPNQVGHGPDGTTALTVVERHWSFAVPLEGHWSFEAP
jgi:hypothetical protein